MTDKYADTNANPYADKADNNEAENINTKAVKRGETINYQVWLDTTKFDANNKDNIQTVGITDNYDEAKLDVKVSDIKAYDGKTGKDVTDKFNISIANGVITANLKDGFTKSLGDAETLKSSILLSSNLDVTTSLSSQLRLLTVLTMVLKLKIQQLK